MVFPSLDVFRNAGVGETRFPRLPESDKDALRSAGLRYTGSDTYRSNPCRTGPQGNTCRAL
ncbi:hypothetical protein BZH78_04555 [Salmonella enterica]|nr:hypothetical protein [Salmonella enterica]EBV7267888.1 hypothetical protein [Salmonella enterica subsp. enterica serovar Havana]EAM6394635.1 hypothetical protein [Salmonella enterica]EAN4590329.1 hypothetical protein [Salmonella enterica]EAP5060365.1 hypothetical protein [Salmonella enterica]